MNDLMAFGVLRVLQKKAKRVPEDVSVLGMDDLEIAEMVTPPLTTVHYPLKELVENAMELLIKQISTKETLTETIVLEPSMTIRASTARCAELVHGAPGRH
jgi:DNA-binding LacI/PurR family transcriptional regulator